MTHPTWPSILPAPRRDTHGLRRPDTRRRRLTDAGAPGYQRRLTLQAKLMSVGVTVTQPLKEVFDRFFEDDCAHGTAYFWMPDPTRQDWPLLDESFEPLTFEDGEPWTDEAMLLCCWADTLPEEGDWKGVTFTIRFDVWVMP
ncbi:hypothetical protein [Sagittula sp. S175]|uniref:hypothetical protein n=1 Tax=Sagittula sp. S175 TaxID=3415129 RepID=UPI003C7C9201